VFLKRFRCRGLARSLTLEELRRMLRERLRTLFALSYTSRPRYRSTRRSLEDSLRLALLAREASRMYLEVIAWEKGRRIVRLGRSLARRGSTGSL
jgi:hypothetical protein